MKNLIISGITFFFLMAASQSLFADKITIKVYGSGGLTSVEHSDGTTTSTVCPNSASNLCGTIVIETIARPNAGDQYGELILADGQRIPVKIHNMNARTFGFKLEFEPLN